MTPEAVAAYAEAYGRFIEAGEHHAVSQERLAQARCAEVLARRGAKRPRHGAKRPKRSATPPGPVSGSRSTA